MSLPPTMSLPVPLTPDELKMRAVELGKAIAESDDVEVEKKSVSDHFKDRLDTKIRSIGRIVRERGSPLGEERFQRREVPVSYVKNFERGTVETMRLDTGVNVDTRPMNERERQAGLFEEQEKAEDATPSKAKKTGKKQVAADPGHA